jgi:hypothetical protein
MSNLEQIVAKSAARYVSFETNLDLMPGWRECSILLRHHPRPCLVCTSLGVFNVRFFSATPVQGGMRADGVADG